MHFRFDIWMVDWTGLESTEVIDCDQAATPTLVTTPQPENAVAGQEIRDLAQLLDGQCPTGTLEFKLYDEAETLLFTSEIEVRGNGTYQSEPYTVPSAAEDASWHWEVHYSGDGNNDAVDSAEEPVEIHAETRQIMSSDLFAFIDESIPDQDQVHYPGIARFDDPDFMKQWFERTDEDQ